MVLAQPFLTPFVGRADELAEYRQLLSRTTSSWVWMIVAQGGIGKSTLIRHFARETPPDIACLTLNFATPSLQIDPLTVLEELAWQIEPYVNEQRVQAFRHTLQDGRAKLSVPVGNMEQKIQLEEGASFQGQGMQLNINTATLELRREVRLQVTSGFYGMVQTLSTSRLVLLLDTCEWLGESEGFEVGQWFLKEFLPQLHERLTKWHKQCSVVIASRIKLSMERMQGQDVYSYVLPFLSKDAIHDYLSQIGMSDADLREKIAKITYGHALCVEIIGILWQERGVTSFSNADLPDFQDQFNERALLDFLQDRLYQRLPSPFRELTKYSSLLRRFDLPLLEAVYTDILPEKNRADLFEQFIRYPYIETRGRNHYACHDLLRELQATRIHAQEFAKWNEYHQRALMYLAKMKPYPPEYYYHAIALDESEGMSLWFDAIQDAYIRDKRDVFNALLQVAHDETLELSQHSCAVRAQWQGKFYYYGSEMSAALESYDEALKLFRVVGDRLGEANCYLAQGRVALQQDDNDTALTLHNNAYRLYQLIQSPYSQARLLYFRSLVYEARGENMLAIKDTEEALAVFERLQHPFADTLHQRLEKLRHQ